MLSITEFLKPFQKSPTALTDPVLTHTRPTITNDFGKNLANYLDFNLTNGPWLAGGMVRKLYLNEQPRCSDWDIWFKNQKQFDQAIQAIDNLVHASKIFESKNAITYHYIKDAQEHKIQLICKKFYNDPLEIIDDFDLTICQFVTDGYKLITGDLTIQDINSRTMRLVNNNVIYRNNIVNRIIKYSVYGYSMHPSLHSLISTNQTQIKRKSNSDDYESV